MRSSSIAAMAGLLAVLSGCGGGAGSAPPVLSNASGGETAKPLPTDASFVIAGGGNRTIAAGASIILGVPALSIPNGDNLSYTWTLTSKPAGSNATLAAATSAQARLTPDLPGNYVASLVASDGKRLSVAATSTVNALEATAFKGFVDLVNTGACNDIASDLFLIDGKYVFAHTAGNCADASDSAALYGLTPTQPLCSVSDSVAGPRRNCPDASAGALFDKIFANRNVTDLGLGSAHTVSKFSKPAPVPSGATALGFTVLDQGISQHASATPAASVTVARTAAEWTALWSGHKSGTVAPALDFSKQTAVALYYLQLSSCLATEVNSVYLQNGQLVVSYTTKSTAAADTACTQIAYPAAAIFTVDQALDASIPVVLRKAN